MVFKAILTPRLFKWFSCLTLKHVLAVLQVKTCIEYSVFFYLSITSHGRGCTSQCQVQQPRRTMEIHFLQTSPNNRVIRLSNTQQTTSPLVARPLSRSPSCALVKSCNCFVPRHSPYSMFCTWQSRYTNKF